MPLGEQRLYSESFLDDRASHPISKEGPRHPVVESHQTQVLLLSTGLQHPESRSEAPHLHRTEGCCYTSSRSGPKALLSCFS